MSDLVQQADGSWARQQLVPVTPETLAQEKQDADQAVTDAASALETAQVNLDNAKAAAALASARLAQVNEAPAQPAAAPEAPAQPTPEVAQAFVGDGAPEVPRV